MKEFYLLQSDSGYFLGLWAAHASASQQFITTRYLAEVLGRALVAVNRLGNLLALLVTPANAHERAQAVKLAEQIRKPRKEACTLACGDQGYTGLETVAATAEYSIHLEGIKLAEQ